MTKKLTLTSLMIATTLTLASCNGGGGGAVQAIELAATTQAEFDAVSCAHHKDVRLS